jgi:hypothetical protein
VGIGGDMNIKVEMSCNKCIYKPYCTDIEGPCSLEHHTEPDEEVIEAFQDEILRKAEE